MSSSKFSALVVQAISVSWTKNARGGLLATLRNRIPEMSRLSFIPSSKEASAPILIRHEISWDEKNEFQAPLKDGIVTAEFTGVAKTGCIGVYAFDNVIKVAFEGSYSLKSGRKVLENYTRLGAPARTVPTEIFSLKPGDWGQVRYNGRYSWEGGWSYAKWVYNIGWFANTIPVDLFEKPPIKSYASMADLR